jgi:hypothetical protein
MSFDFLFPLSYFFENKINYLKSTNVASPCEVSSIRMALQYLKKFKSPRTLDGQTIRFRNSSPLVSQTLRISFLFGEL